MKITTMNKFDLSAMAKKVFYSGKINFAYTIRPIYHISRIVGLFPFTIVHDLNGDVQEAQVNLLDFLWFKISICMYLLMAYYYCDGLEWSATPHVSFVLTIGDNLLMIFGMLYGAIVVIADMCNRSRLICILKQFTIFDKEVSDVYTFLPRIILVL